MAIGKTGNGFKYVVEWRWSCPKGERNLRNTRHVKSI
jgi:hypothetical protein